MTNGLEILRNKLKDLSGVAEAPREGVPFFLGKREAKDSLFLVCEYIHSKKSKGIVKWYCGFKTHIDEFIYGKLYRLPDSHQELTTKGSVLFSCNGCQQQLLQKLKNPK